MKKVGFIGLGKMGRPMACNLLRAGFSLTVFDVSPGAVCEMVEAGASRGISPRDVVEKSEVILLSLPDSRALQTVVSGDEGLTSVTLGGKTIIDTSTVTLAATLQCASAIAECGGEFLDSPVTGGVYGAERGALQFFVGGSEEAFKAHRDIYVALGNMSTRIGDSGHGQVGKMICQMIGSVSFIVNAEALALCDDLGVDAAAVGNAFHSGKRLAHMARLRDGGDYGNEGYLAQRGKDLDCVIEAADKNNTFMPVTRVVQELFMQAREAGLGRANPEAIFELWNKMQAEI